MTREKKDKPSSGAQQEFQALFERSVYDAYYLAQGLLGGTRRSLEAVEEAMRRVKEKMGRQSQEALDNLVLQQVAEICRARGDNAFIQDESGADYIALMSMPLRSRQVLMLADMLRLGDNAIAQIMHSRKDRMVRLLKEARADLARRCAGGLGKNETVEQIIERNCEPLTTARVQALWSRLGGESEAVKQWVAPAMIGAVRKSWPLAVALGLSVVVLMGLVVMIVRNWGTAASETEPTGFREAAQVITSRVPTTLSTVADNGEPTYEVKITLGGDTVLGGLPGRDERGDSFSSVTGNESTYPFAKLLPVLSRDDLTILNLECTLTEETRAVSGQEYPFRGKPEAANMLVAGSVEIVSLENSHSGDYGEEGYADTKAALSSAGIGFVDRENSMVYTAQGMKIGVAALKDPMTGEDVEATIADLKQKGAKFIILSLHWGEELAQTPSQQQQELARQAIDLGADVIMGHHAHVVQNMEVYRNRPIFYCLGNVVYGGSTNPTDWDIALARITLECQGDEVVRVRWMAIPGSVSGGEAENNYQPVVYAPGTADTIRVYGKLGMSHNQLGDWKKLYDELWSRQTSNEAATQSAEQ